MKAKSSAKRERRSGRPPKEETERIQDQILDAASVSFFRHGYGATSMEAVARQLGVTKRTLYVRFPNKAELFRATVQRVVDRIRPPSSATDILFEGSLADTLTRVGTLVLHAALTAEGLALHRVVLAEAMRFPELALIVNEQGARKEAIKRLAMVLARNSKAMRPTDCEFAAEQFLNMIAGLPQRRALGLGQPMTEPEMEPWVRKTVQLFLKGCDLDGPGQPLNPG